MPEYIQTEQEEKCILSTMCAFNWMQTTIMLYKDRNKSYWLEDAHNIKWVF